MTLLDHERRAVEVRPTESLDAYQAYLQGHYYSRQPHFSLESWKRAVQSYERAVELDPGFALALAELSQAHARLYYMRHDLSEERRNLARRAAERALELAPESPEVHLALGYYFLWTERDVDQALEEFAFASRNLPESAEVLAAKAEAFRLRGSWEESLNHYRRAVELSPRDASHVLEVGINCWWMRRYADALDACNEAVSLAPDQAWPYLIKAMNYWSWDGAVQEARVALEAVSPEHSWSPWAWFWQEIYEGRYQKALDRLSCTSGEWSRLKMWARPKSLLSACAYELLKEPQLALAAYESAKILLEPEVRANPNDPRYHSSLGIAYAGLGLKEEAIREGKRAVELLPIAKDAAYGLPYVHDLARIYAIVGEDAAALDELEYLLSIPSWWSVPLLQIDPRWDRIRDHPRFQRMLEKYSEHD